MKKKKSGGLIISIFSLLIVAAIVVGIAKVNNINDPISLYNWAFKKSTDFGKKLNDCVQNNNCGNSKIEVKLKDSTKKEVINKDEIQKSLETIKVAVEEKVKYNRKDWKHWRDIRPCWNTREEVLYRDSQKDSLKLLDKNKKETKNKEDACYIVKGKWIDAYSGEVITDPKLIDIDHIIPLGRVAKFGGNSWDSKKKETYANDPDVLISVSARENRSKSDKGPEKYMPAKTTLHCDYAKKYIKVANKYNLPISEKDKEVLKRAIGNCR